MADSVEKIALRNAFAKKLSKTEAASTYLGKNEKAVSATTADSATKATTDGNGNNIVNTYATKTALSSIEQRLAAIESNYVTKNNPVMTGTVTIEG